jgi:hypothetical protein
MSTTPLDTLLQALRSHPDDAVLQARAVQACIDSGDAFAFERVFAEFGTYLRLDDELRAHAIAFALRRHQRALVACLRSGSAAQRWLQTSREQLAEGDRDGAHESLRRARRLDPDLDDGGLAAAFAPPDPE